MNLKDKTLSLLFSQGVSLQTWVDTGLFDREVALYRRLAEHLGHINFITQGGPADGSLATGVEPDIAVAHHGHRLLGRLARFSGAVTVVQHWRLLAQSDLVKTNQLSAAAPAILAKRLLGKKLLTRCGYLWSYNARQEGIGRLRLAHIERLERQVFELADASIVTTERIRDMVLQRYRVDPDRVRVIPNYVDTARFCPLPDAIKEPGLLVFVGRLEREKNLDNLLRGLAIAEGARRDGGGGAEYHLEIYGEGSLKGRLQRLAEELGVEVRFKGRVPNSELPGLLNRAEALALVSLYEGHPKTPLEAMACGLPVIGTEVNGIVDEIEHGETGYLCGTGAEEIAEAITTVMGHADLRTKLGAAGRRFVEEHYSLDRIVDMELALVRELLTDSDGRGA